MVDKDVYDRIGFNLNRNNSITWHNLIRDYDDKKRNDPNFCEETWFHNNGLEFGDPRYTLKANILIGVVLCTIGHVLHKCCLEYK